MISINPTTAVLTDLETQQFTATSDGSPVNAVWTINPDVGKIAANNGLYIAPGQVPTAQDIVVTATPTAGGPASVAVIRLQPRVIITPTSVSLKAGQTQKFEVTVKYGVAKDDTAKDDAAKGVTWVVSPSLGTMAAGSYQAPDVVREAETITLSAKSVADPSKIATATVQLIPAQPFWTWILGVGLYVAFLFVLVWPFIKLWPSPPPDRSKLDQATAATAAAESAAKLKALAADAALQKSTRSGEAAKSAPQGSAAKVQADQDEAALDQANKEKAQADTELEQRLTAEKAEADKISGGGEDLVTVFGKFTRDVDLILLVLFAGALGAWIHVARSYVDFVGNRAFRTNWVPWYLLHPMLGAGLALIFYLGVRGGFFISGTKGTDVNPYGVTAVAGLVGLFSKQATNKLSELFDTLFKTDKGKELRDKLDPQAKTG